MNDKEEIQHLCLLVDRLNEQIAYLEHLVDTVIADRDMGEEIHREERQNLMNIVYFNNCHGSIH